MTPNQNGPKRAVFVHKGECSGGAQETYHTLDEGLDFYQKSTECMHICVQNHPTWPGVVIYENINWCRCEEAQSNPSRNADEVCGVPYSYDEVNYPAYRYDIVNVENVIVPETDVYAVAKYEKTCINETAIESKDFLGDVEDINTFCPQKVFECKNTNQNVVYDRNTDVCSCTDNTQCTSDDLDMYTFNDETGEARKICHDLCKNDFVLYKGTWCSCIPKDTSVYEDLNAIRIHTLQHGMSHIKYDDRLHFRGKETNKKHKMKVEHEMTIQSNYPPRDSCRYQCFWTRAVSVKIILTDGDTH